MSRVGKGSLICELCGEKLEVDIYESINVTLNPHLKEKVLNGDIYKFTCPFCKHDHYISYPFVYFDMENKYMIHMGKLPELMNLYYSEIKNDSLSNDFPGLCDSILHLGVDSYRELCSKIVMLDHGIDYKVGTLYSLVIEHKYQKLIDAAHKEGEPKAEVCDSFFATHDGNVIVVVDVALNDEAETHRTLSEIFDSKLYRKVYDLYKTKADEVFNFLFNRDVARKLIRVNNKIDKCKNLIIDVAILETTDGDSLLASSSLYNKGKYNIGDLVCVKDNDKLKKCLIKNLFNVDLYTFPLLKVNMLSYKIADIILETQADSRDVIANDELKVMFNNYNEKGFNEKLMIKSNVIVGAECRIIPTTGEIQTRLIKYNNDGKTLLSVYLEQNELTNENASRFIYNLDDVIRLVLNNPDRYDGIIINPESDKVIIENSNLVEYGYNRIMCNSYLMKRLLDKLSPIEIAYIGDFNYKVIKKVYNEKTSPKKIAEDLNVCYEKVDKALTNGYNSLKKVVLTNYLNMEL